MHDLLFTHENVPKNSESLFLRGLSIRAIFVAEFSNVFISTRTLISPQEHQFRAYALEAAMFAECLSE